ncbi:hypothetical protein EDF22_0622 [Rathayibacter sp. PhB127]|uniref:hypothetical protein n=1 Tax=Rathayibacter sp. PhB127 TaxID=2485176 RepID=UPI000F4B3EE6|nr:hypothetical protein [Rathayibacter sp. PhB127]ROS28891.1 hypothetical protein EDF22_0622 [Rathayibacter sp. PhB127]
MTAEPLTQDAVRALIEEADPHVVDPSSGWVCCDWCGETRDQECESCEKAWPCVTRRLADTLAAPIAEATPTHCPSCDGYQTAVMDDGQRSVGVCEGVEARMVETVEDWETIRAALARRAEMVTPGLDMSVIEEIRRAIPPTPDEVRRLAAKIIARERPLLDRLAAHDGTEEDDRG